jgi:hypothetical protein
MYQTRAGPLHVGLGRCYCTFGQKNQKGGVATNCLSHLFYPEEAISQRDCTAVTPYQLGITGSAALRLELIALPPSHR